LICPIRTVTHRRLYSLNDLKIAQTIHHLIHDHGMNFAGIRRLMALLPCWKIRGCDLGLFRRFKVPYLTDAPCWSSGEALWRKSNVDCQSSPVYKTAYRIGDLSIHHFMLSINN
jgi:MerR family transcriptional regulator/heat shock protein HspR